MEVKKLGNGQIQTAANFEPEFKLTDEVEEQFLYHCKKIILHVVNPMMLALCDRLWHNDDQINSVLSPRESQHSNQQPNLQLLENKQLEKRQSKELKNLLNELKGLDCDLKTIANIQKYLLSKQVKGMKQKDSCYNSDDTIPVNVFSSLQGIWGEVKHIQSEISGSFEAGDRTKVLKNNVSSKFQQILLDINGSVKDIDRVFRNVLGSSVSETQKVYLTNDGSQDCMDENKGRSSNQITTQKLEERSSEVQSDSEVFQQIKLTNLLEETGGFFNKATKKSSKNSSEILTVDEKIQDPVTGKNPFKSKDEVENSNLPPWNLPSFKKNESLGSDTEIKDDLKTLRNFDDERFEIEESSYSLEKDSDEKVSSRSIGHHDVSHPGSGSLPILSVLKRVNAKYLQQAEKALHNSMCSGDEEGCKCRLSISKDSLADVEMIKFAHEKNIEEVMNSLLSDTFKNVEIEDIFDFKVTPSVSKFPGIKGEDKKFFFKPQINPCSDIDSLEVLKSNSEQIESDFKLGLKSQSEQSCNSFNESNAKLQLHNAIGSSPSQSMNHHWGSGYSNSTMKKIIHFRDIVKMLRSVIYTLKIEGITYVAHSPFSLTTEGQNMEGVSQNSSHVENSLIQETNIVLNCLLEEVFKRILLIKYERRIQSEVKILSDGSLNEFFDSGQGGSLPPPDFSDDFVKEFDSANSPSIQDDSCVKKPVDSPIDHDGTEPHEGEEVVDIEQMKDTLMEEKLDTSNSPNFPNELTVSNYFNDSRYPNRTSNKTNYPDQRKGILFSEEEIILPPFRSIFSSEVQRADEVPPFDATSQDLIRVSVFDELIKQIATHHGYSMKGTFSISPRPQSPNQLALSATSDSFEDEIDYNEKMKFINQCLSGIDNMWTDFESDENIKFGNAVKNEEMKRRMISLSEGAITNVSMQSEDECDCSTIKISNESMLDENQSLESDGQPPEVNYGFSNDHRKECIGDGGDSLDSSASDRYSKPESFAYDYVDVKAENKTKINEPICENSAPLEEKKPDKSFDSKNRKCSDAPKEPEQEIKLKPSSNVDKLDRKSVEMLLNHIISHLKTGSVSEFKPANFIFSKKESNSDSSVSDNDSVETKGVKNEIKKIAQPEAPQNLSTGHKFSKKNLKTFLPNSGSFKTGLAETLSQILADKSFSKSVKSTVSTLNNANYSSLGSKKPGPISSRHLPDKGDPMQRLNSMATACISTKSRVSILTKISRGEMKSSDSSMGSDSRSKSRKSSSKGTMNKIRNSVIGFSRDKCEGSKSQTSQSVAQKTASYGYSSFSRIKTKLLEMQSSREVLDVSSLSSRGASMHLIDIKRRRMKRTEGSDVDASPISLSRNSVEDTGTSNVSSTNSLGERSYRGKKNLCEHRGQRNIYKCTSGSSEASKVDNILPTSSLSNFSLTSQSSHVCPNKELDLETDNSVNYFLISSTNSISQNENTASVLALEPCNSYPCGHVPLRRLPEKTELKRSCNDTYISALDMMNDCEKLLIYNQLLDKRYSTSFSSNPKAEQLVQILKSVNDRFMSKVSFGPHTFCKTIGSQTSDREVQKDVRFEVKPTLQCDLSDSRETLKQNISDSDSPCESNLELPKNHEISSSKPIESCQNLNLQPSDTSYRSAFSEIFYDVPTEDSDLSYHLEIERNFNISCARAFPPITKDSLQRLAFAIQTERKDLAKNLVKRQTSLKLRDKKSRKELSRRKKYSESIESTESVNADKEQGDDYIAVKMQDFINKKNFRNKQKLVIKKETSKTEELLPKPDRAKKKSSLQKHGGNIRNSKKSILTELSGQSKQPSENDETVDSTTDQDESIAGKFEREDANSVKCSKSNKTYTREVGFQQALVSHQATEDDLSNEETPSKTEHQDELMNKEKGQKSDQTHFPRKKRGAGDKTSKTSQQSSLKTQSMVGNQGHFEKRLKFINECTGPRTNSNLPIDSSKRVNGCRDPEMKSASGNQEPLNKKDNIRSRFTRNQNNRGGKIGSTSVNSPFSSLYDSDISRKTFRSDGESLVDPAMNANTLMEFFEKVYCVYDHTLQCSSCKSLLSQIIEEFITDLASSKRKV